jgi:uncharacterized protein YndB with AHSA1/START domain
VIRAVSQTVFIETSPPNIWRALTNARALACWLPRQARIDAQQGGSVWLSWSEEAEGTATITLWEPYRRLQWTEDTGAVVNFHLESRTGCTAVRVVQSGGDADTASPDTLEANRVGWGYFLHHLKWYLERHRNAQRQLISWRHATDLSPASAFLRLLGPAGLSSRNVFANLHEGDLYKTTTSTGEDISGTIVAFGRETRQLGVTIKELSDAIALIEVDGPAEGDPGAVATFWLSTYGLSWDVLAQVRLRYERLYRNAFAEPDPIPAPHSRAIRRF